MDDPEQNIASRLQALDRCDAALADKPNLASVFDEEWRASFRARAEADHNPYFGFPTAYYWPELPDRQLHERIEAGLGLMLSKMTPTPRRELCGRLRQGHAAPCDELIAADAFALEFGGDAVTAPTGAAKKPEFFVESEGVRWAVECKALFDSAHYVALNDAAIASGKNCWIDARSDLDREKCRFQRAIVEKIAANQGGGPVVLMVVSRTAWLMPDEMQAVVCRILRQPEAVGLAVAQLPLAIACLYATTLHGVWFSPATCAAAGFSRALCERIRAALISQYVPRPGGPALSEAGCTEPIWSPREPCPPARTSA